MISALHDDGYVCIRKWMRPIPALVARDIREGMTAGKHEVPVRDTCGLSKWVLANFPGHRYGGAIFRFTPATCQTIGPHCDIELTQRSVPDNKIPLTLLVSLDDYVIIDLWPGSHRDLRSGDQTKYPKIEQCQVQMYLYEGDALLMRGDVVHAGIHGRKCILMIYIDHPECPRPRGHAYVFYRSPKGELRARMAENEPRLPA